MNIIEVILKMIFGATSASNGISSAAEISKQILAQLKNVLKSLIILFICAVIFCLLTGYLIDRTLTQIDSGAVILTNSIILLIILIVINLIVMAWALRKASEKDEPTPKEVRSMSRNEDSPLETALAALILSFVRERETHKKESTEDGV